MRIISGNLKARRFSIPKSFPSRPTTDFAKEGLFNMLENKLDLYDLEILDLCAGTGNISFEFASREAGNIIAVDQNFNAVSFIRSKAKEFGISENINVVKSDILTYLKKCDRKFDLIFVDPPYDFKFYSEVHQLILDKNLMNPDGLLIIEHAQKTDLKNLANYSSNRNFGNVSFSFFNFNKIEE